ncbi:hypothetical protein NSK_005209 [Nannochloropsis salina CCMP1776]|jgi:hypothetical protein|uniref:PPIase cyclophilin-type domain-containing protein n=1 Tax=Nannochloropsis salina CCMP1776 TaxID=1027361 RepID=A0A4D9D204_9STRA|nr:hypothetical protein NSK_005209 [Nannochloropsis salina CCMP1776]|eukprot:TFJ83495.1 hypothetical protein NSK_005209 [Nannochloropsis salina CCMP1776]
MFRHLRLLVVAFLAVTDGTKNHTATRIKDTKPSGNKGNKKTKTATFCVDVSYDSAANEAVEGFLAVTQGPLFDCDVVGRGC